MEPQIRLKRELVYKGHVIDFYCDTIQTETGHIAYFDYIGHKGAAAVVAVADDGRLLMVRQYRNALDRFTLELPAGGRNTADESGMDCAARELEEETGYRAEKLEFLMAVNTTVAFCNEKIDIFVATNLKPSRQNLDEDEFVEVAAYTVDELVGMIKNGTITDSKTISGILLYKEKYCL